MFHVKPHSYTYRPVRFGVRPSENDLGQLRGFCCEMWSLDVKRLPYERVVVYRR